VTFLSPNDISGLRRPKNVKFGTKVAFSTRMMHALRFLEKKFSCAKIGIFGVLFPFLCKTPFFQKHLQSGAAYTVVPHIRRYGIYVALRCVWIIHTLSVTVRSTEDPVMTVALVVQLMFEIGIHSLDVVVRNNRCRCSIVTVVFGLQNLKNTKKLHTSVITSTGFTLIG